MYEVVPEAKQHFSYTDDTGSGATMVNFQPLFMSVAYQLVLGY
jgi:hypothetical protein